MQIENEYNKYRASIGHIEQLIVRQEKDRCFLEIRKENNK